MSPALHLASAEQFTASEIAAALNAGYEGYFVPISFSAEGLERAVRIEDIDLGASHLIIAQGGTPIGAMLIARRGSTSRIAGLGISRPFRGMGAGRFAVERAVADARLRGDDKMVLEVISANGPALKLYKSFGFRIVRRLLGFETEQAQKVMDSAEWLACPPATAAHLIAPHLPGDLPWQMTQETVSMIASQARGIINAERNAALLYNFAEGRGRVICLAVVPHVRRRGIATKMISTAVANLAGRWQVPAIVPEGPVKRVFAGAGWKSSDISQFEMSISLDPE